MQASSYSASPGERVSQDGLDEALAQLVLAITTGLAEEPGWRDFALVRLQDRLGPINGTVPLGVLWGGWHLPLFLSTWGGWPHVLWYEPIEFVGVAIALSFPITWVFNRTGQSLPLVMLLHANVTPSSR